MLQSLRIGISLQVVFFILFFSAMLANMNNILGAMISSVIGLLSLIIGIKSIISRQNIVLALMIIVISILILGFTVFAYFIGEGGLPPLIMQ
ncbi:hypothetical protein M3210_14225 [Oceanobacillus luteolus]|uniref:Uncharacterized protein n=1 Tax=Oceanobacillus luteolus TaxID=1274358 RepID=A0ABW4HSW9_9BACI|nr:hypothetical protein [Oceanobacillus luteolus]MCM3741426.1 hypothetical protein [Oceanobacillus luteolus]